MGWWLLPLVSAVAVVGDLVARQTLMASWSGEGFARFGASAVASVVIAAGVALVTGAARPTWPRLSAVAVTGLALAWGALQGLSHGYHAALGGWPVPSALQYVASEPASALALAAPYVAKPAHALVICIGLALPPAAAWLAVRRAPPARLRVGVACLLVGVALVAALALRPARYHHCVADVYAMLTAGNVLRLHLLGHEPRLSRPHRLRLGPITPVAPPPHVLVLVLETFGAEAMASYGSPQAATPRLDALAAGRGLPNGARALRFAHAQTNAGSTLVSVPSLLSGLAPDVDAPALHSQPMLWNIAQAAGYWTFLATPQSYDWADLDKFLLADGLDAWFTAERSAAPVLNDVGIDDALAVDAALGFVDTALEAGRRFAGVVQFNASHMPYYAPAALQRRWPRLRPFDDDRQLSAIHYVDQQVGRIIDHLAARGVLAETMIWVVADHGHHHAGRRLPLRIHDYFDEIARTPSLLALPPALARQLEQDGRWQQLAGNVDARVSNVDMVPTLADLLGLSAQLPAPVRAAWAGHALTQPLPPDRPVVMTNCSSFRTTSEPGFALVHGEHKFLAQTHAGRCLQGLYAWRTDPEERHDLWPTADAATKARWQSRIAARPRLAALYRQACGDQGSR